MNSSGTSGDGGFFFTSSDHEALIARSKGPNDGARPSGNSVSAENLVYLGKTLKEPNNLEPKYLDFAEKTIAARSGMMKQVPLAFPRMFTALSALLDVRKPSKAKD